jgi:hypothetical protein
VIGAERDAVDVPTRVRVPVAVPIVVPAAVAAVVVVTGSAIAESPAVVRGRVDAVLVAVRVSSVSEGRTDEEARGAVRSHGAETHAGEECRLRLGAPEPESRRRRHRQCCPRLGTHAVLLRKVPRPGNAWAVPSMPRCPKHNHNSTLQAFVDIDPGPPGCPETGTVGGSVWTLRPGGAGAPGPAPRTSALLCGPNRQTFAESSRP